MNRSALLRGFGTLSGERGGNSVELLCPLLKRDLNGKNLLILGAHSFLSK